MTMTPLRVAQNRAARLTRVEPAAPRLAYTTTTGDAPRGPSRAQRADEARMEAIREEVATIMRRHNDADACCAECDMTRDEREVVDALWDEYGRLWDRWA